MVKTVFDAKTGELLGAHMIGAEVTELIQGYTIARTLETHRDRADPHDLPASDLCRRRCTRRCSTPTDGRSTFSGHAPRPSSTLASAPRAMAAEANDCPNGGTLRFRLEPHDTAARLIPIYQIVTIKSERADRRQARLQGRGSLSRPAITPGSKRLRNDKLEIFIGRLMLQSRLIILMNSRRQSSAQS